MKSGRGGSRPAEKVVAAVAAKGEWDTSRPRLAYSSGKHKEEGNNSRESSTRKNIYGSVIPPCALLEFFFFLATNGLPFFFFIYFYARLFANAIQHLVSLTFCLFPFPFFSLSLFRLYVRSFRLDPLFNLWVSRNRTANP